MMKFRSRECMAKFRQKLGLKIKISESPSKWYISTNENRNLKRWYILTLRDISHRSNTVKMSRIDSLLVDEQQINVWKWHRTSLEYICVARNQDWFLVYQLKSYKKFISFYLLIDRDIEIQKQRHTHREIKKKKIDDGRTLKNFPHVERGSLCAFAYVARINPSRNRWKKTIDWWRKKKKCEAREIWRSRPITNRLLQMLRIWHIWIYDYIWNLSEILFSHDHITPMTCSYSLSFWYLFFVVAIVTANNPCHRCWF